jgi:hypothetical protein
MTLGVSGWPVGAGTACGDTTEEADSLGFEHVDRKRGLTTKPAHLTCARCAVLVDKALEVLGTPKDVTRQIFVSEKQVDPTSPVGARYDVRSVPIFKTEEVHRVALEHGLDRLLNPRALRRAINAALDRAGVPPPVRRPANW